jgi:hypothetical protein
MSFKQLDPEDFTFDTDSVVAPIWSTLSSSLFPPFYTSSFQQSSIGSKYYVDVYNSDPNANPNAQIQFSIAYADKNGSGSAWYSYAAPYKSPSRTVYGQFTNLLLGEDENNSFRFGGDNDMGERFYVITIDRSNYKQSIMPGSLQIKGLAPGANTYITDNSLITSVIDYTPAGRRYTLGSGSFGNGALQPSPDPDRNPGIAGYLYPDVGIIILNPLAFNPDLPQDIFDFSNNRNKNLPDALRRFITQFTLQSQETIPSNYIFCRAKNHEFNFSTQPNFISSSRNLTSSLNEFVSTPSTYITSVGLYNDNHELLAVAKLSKPLKKDFTTEALIRVKLDF